MFSAENKLSRSSTVYLRQTIRVTILYGSNVIKYIGTVAQFCTFKKLWDLRMILVIKGVLCLPVTYLGKLILLLGGHRYSRGTNQILQEWG